MGPDKRTEPYSTLRGIQVCGREPLGLRSRTAIATAAQSADNPTNETVATEISSGTNGISADAVSAAAKRCRNPRGSPEEWYSGFR